MHQQAIPHTSSQDTRLVTDAAVPYVSITFLKVAILFLLVDLEIALLIPIFNKRGILLKSLTRLIKCMGVISLFLVGLLLVEKLSGSLS